jgi:hypothetical protein
MLIRSSRPGTWWHNNRNVCQLCSTKNADCMSSCCLEGTTVFQIVRTTSSMTQHHILEDTSPQQHCCENQNFYNVSDITVPALQQNIKYSWSLLSWKFYKRLSLHSETILKSSHSTTLNCMQYHAVPLPLYEARKSNKGSRDSTVGLVNRLQVVKQSNIASIPSEDSPLARSMQIGYWAHTAYYSMGTGDKAAGAWNRKSTTI